VLGSNWLTATIWFFKTSGNIRSTTRSHFLEYLNLQHHRCGNLKFGNFETAV